MKKETNAKATAEAADAAAAAAANATEEILVDFLENEIEEQDKAAIRGDLRSSVKLRRALEGLAAVRFEIANAELEYYKRATCDVDFAQLHKKILAKIENAAAAATAAHRNA